MNHIGDGNKMVGDTPMTEAAIAMSKKHPYRNQMERELHDFARQLERELQEANKRIRLLIAERDTARMQADQNWKLREEFTALLGTDDVKEAVRELKRLKAQKISTTQTK